MMNFNLGQISPDLFSFKLDGMGGEDEKKKKKEKAKTFDPQDYDRDGTVSDFEKKPKGFKAKLARFNDMGGKLGQTGTDWDAIDKGLAHRQAQDQAEGPVQPGFLAKRKKKEEEASGGFLKSLMGQGGGGGLGGILGGLF